MMSRMPPIRDIHLDIQKIRISNNQTIGRITGRYGRPRRSMFVSDQEVTHTTGMLPLLC